MFLLNKINIKIFLIALFIGLYISYVTTPNPEIIIKYPTPENSDTKIYKDNADNCFRFISNEVPCPSEEELISEIPIQNRYYNENFKISRKEMLTDNK